MSYQRTSFLHEMNTNVRFESNIYLTDTYCRKVLQATIEIIVSNQPCYIARHNFMTNYIFESKLTSTLKTETGEERIKPYDGFDKNSSFEKLMNFLIARSL